MVLVVFRNRLREEHAAEYRALAPRMEELARSMPGFVSAKTFSAPDGERVTLVEFESWEHVDAWKAHPEHREAQRLGRERFYAEYRLQSCEPRRDYSHRRREAGTPSGD
jgi:heme-degrading monooxygenase HmoA